MGGLESKTAPFEIGTYSYDLIWQNFRIETKVGSAILQFSKTKLEEVPEPAQKVYDGGDLYKTTFEGRIENKLLKAIAERGTVITYICIRNKDSFPLMSTTETKILMKNIKDTVIYDRQRNNLVINETKHKIDQYQMSRLKDPVSHAIHLLYRPRKKEGDYVSGYYHNSKGQIEPLLTEFAERGDFLIGKTTVPANTYIIHSDLQLELPYRYDRLEEKFMPSLKEVPTVKHKVLGKVQIKNTGFTASQ